MNFDQLADVIGKRSARLVKYKAGELTKQLDLPGYEADDIEQELITDIVERLPKFDPKRAQRDTFIAHLVRNKAASIVADRRRKRCDHRCCRVSLNEIEPEHGQEKIHLVEENYFLEAMGRHSDRSDPHELKIDVRRFVDGLPSHLRTLCLLLQTQNLTDVARDLGMPRSTLYTFVTTIREHMTEAGLHRYKAAG